MISPETVLDPGPIPYAEISLKGDADLEHALIETGLKPEETSYRLIEIPLGAITDTASMPWLTSAAYVDAMNAGQEFRPIVVMRNRRGWSLLDGCHRTHAYLKLGKSSVRAYELLHCCSILGTAARPGLE
jgi:hypothetical protein